MGMFLIHSIHFLCTYKCRPHEIHQHRWFLVNDAMDRFKFGIFSKLSNMVLSVLQESSQSRIKPKSPCPFHCKGGFLTAEPWEKSVPIQRISSTIWLEPVQTCLSSSLQHVRRNHFRYVLTLITGHHIGESLGHIFTSFSKNFNALWIFFICSTCRKIAFLNGLLYFKCLFQF